MKTNINSSFLLGVFFCACTHFLIGQNNCSYVVQHPSGGAMAYEDKLVTDNSGNAYSLSDSLRKISPSGSQIWSFACPFGNITLAIDNLNNAYVAGVLNNSAFDFDPGPGTLTLSPGLFLLKVSPTGNFVWAKSMPYSSSTSGQVLSVYSLEADGTSCYIYGEFKNHTIDFDPGPVTNTLTSSTNGDYFVCKYNLAGTLDWVHTIDGVANSNLFGVSSFPVPKIKTDATGNIYLSGEFCYLTDFDPGSNVFNLPVTTSNSVSTTTYTRNAFVMKLNPSGGFVWAKGFLSDISGLGLDSNNDIYLTGIFYGAVDFDPGPGTYTMSSASPYAADMCVVKLNPVGALIWAKSQSGGISISRVIATSDPNNNIYASGILFYNGSVPPHDWDPGPEQWIYFQAFGGLAHFISKFDKNGNFQWVKFQRGCINASIKADSSYIYFAGITYTSIVDVDPDPVNTFTLGANTPYTAKFGNRGAKVIKTDVACYGESTGSATIQSIDATPPLNYKWYSGAVSPYNFTLMPNVSNVLTNLPTSYIIGKIIDAKGCEFSGFGLQNGASYLTISSFIQEPNSPVSYSVIATNESCIGGGNNGSVSISNVQGGTGPYTYLWLNTSTVNTTTSLPGLAAGNYSVVVTDSKGCDDTTSIIIQKDYNPSSFSYTTNGMVANFSINGAACSSFNWDFGNGNTSNINPSPTVTYATPGTYGICVLCNGLPSSCSQCINITVPGNMSGGVGIDEIKNPEELQLYPNPNNGDFTLNINQGGEGKRLIVFNYLGQMIYQKTLHEDKNIIHLNPPKGLYHYAILTGDTKTHSGKLIIE